MFSIQRVNAVIRARLREFYRDQASFMWNLGMPLMLIVVFATIFVGEPEDVLTVGVIAQDEKSEHSQLPITDLKNVAFLTVIDKQQGIEKIRRHQLDILIEPGSPPQYWVNTYSPKGSIAEQLLLGSLAAPTVMPQRQTVTGKDIRYVDWLMPGVLAMNMMFSCLWGVGWVVVRYRKNGVLRRLKATPLTAFEFLTAQVITRLMVVAVVSSSIFVIAYWLIGFTMRGSYATLFLVYFAGALSLISMGLLVATRISSEELADGLLNLVSWPMMILSGVWFSLETASPSAQSFAHLLPLTHLVNAARSVMIDGATLFDVSYQIMGLMLFGLVVLLISARIFRWE